MLSQISGLGIILTYVTLDDKFSTAAWRYIYLIFAFEHRPIRATLFVAMGLSGIIPVGHLLTLVPVLSPQITLIVGRSIT